MKTAIVLGVNARRGLGGALCERFASEGLHVVAAGRTRERLEEIVEAITRAGGSAEACVTDATREDDVARLVGQAGANLKLAIYNAGNSTPGRLAEMETAYFEQSWRVICYGGFLFAHHAARQLQTNGAGGTILFTGASASLRGKSGFGAFNSAKAGLRTMAQALAKEHGPEGIHVGHVIVDGPIDGDRIRRANPEYADSLGEDRLISIDGIVDGYVYLYRQPPRAWTFELDVRTSFETW